MPPAQSRPHGGARFDIQASVPSRKQLGRVLRDLCANISRHRLFVTARHKYQSDLYLQRSQVRRTFEQFLGSEQRCFVLIGPSGVGKSNFMLVLAEELHAENDHCTLMYDAAFLPVKPGLAEIVDQDFKERLAAATWPTAEGWAKLTGVIDQNNSLFILGVDALNEHPHPRELLRQLDELAQAALPRLKIIFTVRPESWQALRHSLPLAEA